MRAQSASVGGHAACHGFSCSIALSSCRCRARDAAADHRGACGTLPAQRPKCYVQSPRSSLSANPPNLTPPTPAGQPGSCGERRRGGCFQGQEGWDVGFSLSCLSCCFGHRGDAPSRWCCCDVVGKWQVLLRQAGWHVVAVVVAVAKEQAGGGLCGSGGRGALTRPKQDTQPSRAGLASL